MNRGDDVITTFYGADAKCGVTMICQEIAQALADLDTSKKVILLNLSGSPGTEFSNLDFNYCIDDIHIKLKSEVMTVEELIGACVVQKNLYVLAGSKNIKIRKEFYPEEITSLLELAQFNFDYVIVDAGSAVDYGLNIGALLKSDRRILVTTQSKQAWRSFRQKYVQILAPLKISFDKLIVNKLFMGSGMLSQKEIASSYELSSDSLELSPYGLQAEKDSCKLSKLDRYVKKDITRLVSNLFFKADCSEKKGFKFFLKEAR